MASSMESSSSLDSSLVLVVTPKPSTNEQVERVTDETLQLVLEREQGLSAEDVEKRAGIRLDRDPTHQRYVTKQVANCINAIVQELENDANFVNAVERLDVGSETSAYSAFVDVALGVCGMGTRGITWYRVVALLVFAAKLVGKFVSRAADESRRIVRIIKDWVIRFVGDYLAQWISISGGWAGIQDVAENVERFVSAGWRRYRPYLATFLGGTALGVAGAYLLLRK